MGWQVCWSVELLRQNATAWVTYKQQKVLLTVLEAEVQEQGGSTVGSGESLQLQTAVFSLCPHMAERARELSGSLYKDTNPPS